MKSLTTDILVACGADRLSAAKYVDTLNELLPLYGINTLLRLSHFVGQIMVESDHMKATHEYASGEAYEGRKSLGNTQPGDGKKFRGRGCIQCTGRANYTEFARKYGIDCVNHPELLEQPRWWVASGLWYWNSRSINKTADKDSTLGVSQIINQGSIPKPGVKRDLPNGYLERLALTNRAKRALAPLFATDAVPGVV